MGKERREANDGGDDGTVEALSASADQLRVEIGAVTGELDAIEGDKLRLEGELRILRCLLSSAETEIALRSNGEDVDAIKQIDEAYGEYAKMFAKFLDLLVDEDVDVTRICGLDVVRAVESLFDDRLELRWTYDSRFDFLDFELKHALIRHELGSRGLTKDAVLQHAGAIAEKCSIH